MALTLAVLLGPPVVWYAIEVAVGLVGPRVRSGVHLLGLGLGAMVLFAQIVKHGTDLGEVPIVVLAVVLAALFVLLVARVGAARTWLRFVAIAAPLFAVVFLFTSSVHTVVFGGKNAAVADVRVRSPHRVVWIVFDEFPETSLLDGSGHVDAQLFPNFAELAATSNWYRNSTTIAPFTLAAVPGMLSGNVPPHNDTPAVVANYPDTAFTLLGGAYDVNAFETLTVLCPNQVCNDARHLAPRPHSFGGLATDSLDLWQQFASPERSKPGLDIVRGVLSLDPNPMGTARAFVDSLGPTSAPRLDFLHVLLPHWPWHYVQSTQDDRSIGQPAGPRGRPVEQRVGRDVGARAAPPAGAGDRHRRGPRDGEAEGDRCVGRLAGGGHGRSRCGLRRRGARPRARRHRCARRRVDAALLQAPGPDRGSRRRPARPDHRHPPDRRRRARREDPVEGRRSLAAGRAPTERRLHDGALEDRRDEAEGAVQHRRRRGRVRAGAPQPRPRRRMPMPPPGSTGSAGTARSWGSRPGRSGVPDARATRSW